MYVVISDAFLNELKLCFKNYRSLLPFSRQLSVKRLIENMDVSHQINSLQDANTIRSFLEIISLHMTHELKPDNDDGHFVVNDKLSENVDNHRLEYINNLIEQIRLYSERINKRTDRTMQKNR